MTVFLSFLFCSVLVLISIEDINNRQIPLRYNMVLLVIAIARIFYEPGMLVDRIAGFLAVSGFMLFVTILCRFFISQDAFGGGDIKLMAAAGLFLGLRGIIIAFIIADVLAAIIHTVRMKFFDAGKEMALAPYLCAGVIWVMVG